MSRAEHRDMVVALIELAEQSEETKDNMLRDALNNMNTEELKDFAERNDYDYAFEGMET